MISDIEQRIVGTSQCLAFFLYQRKHYGLRQGNICLYSKAVVQQLFHYGLILRLFGFITPKVQRNSLSFFT